MNRFAVPLTRYGAKSEVSDARFQEIYDRTPVMMHSIDDQSRLVSVNDSWLDVLGYQRDEVLGRPSMDFLTDESRRDAQEVAIPEFWRAGVGKDVEYQMVRKDGDVIDVLLTAASGEAVDDFRDFQLRRDRIRHAQQVAVALKLVDEIGQRRVGHEEAGRMLGRFKTSLTED